MKTKLSSLIIKNLLIKVLNEFKKYNSYKVVYILKTIANTLSVIDRDETDYIMNSLEEILQVLTIIKEEMGNKLNNKKMTDNLIYQFFINDKIFPVLKYIVKNQG